MNIIKRILLKLAAYTPFELRKYLILLDNVSNPKQGVFDSFTLYRHLISTSEYRSVSFYVINKNALINLPKGISQAERDNIIVVDEVNRLPIWLIIRLFRCKFWLDAYQSFPWLGLTKFVESFKGISVYLQHGINAFKSGGLTNNIISENYFDVFVCSSQLERNFVKQHYLYSDKQLPILGLARWDRLQVKEESKIRRVFLYFTYRDYLKGEHVSLIDYYFDQINLLLNELSSRELEIYVGFHHEVVNPQIELFESGNIKFVNEKEIENIKNTADVFITDFSSMCFDMALRNVPVIFYVFDYCRLGEMTGIDRENLTFAYSLISKYKYAKDKKDVLVMLDGIASGSFDSTYASEYFSSSECTPGDICSKITSYLGSINSLDCFSSRSEPEVYPHIKSEALFNFDEDCPIITSGLGNVETCSNPYRAWRWGGRDSKFFLNLDEEFNWELEFDVVAFIAKHHKKIKVDIFVNSIFVCKTIFTKQKAKQIISVPVNGVNGGNVFVRMIVRSTASPANLQMGEDYRELGLCFRTIRIKRSS